MIFKVYKARKQDEMKEKAQLIYTQALITSYGTGIYNPMAGGRNKFPSIHDVFPELFEEQQDDWRKYKEQFLNYANAHNEQ